MSRKLLLALPLAVAALTLSAQATASTVPVIVAKWSMDSTLLATNAAGAVAGSVALIGSTTATYAAGATTGATDKAYNVTHFPAAATGNMSAGIKFSTSTAGFQDVVISWDDRRSATAASSYSFQYSTDGVTFQQFGGVQKITDNSATFLHHSVDLSSISAIDNDALFSFRIVSAFDAAGSSYIGTGSAYGTAGTIRFDNMTIMGSAVSAVPEPETYGMLLAGLGLLGFCARRKASKQA